jgi:hypothetical protein
MHSRRLISFHLEEGVGRRGWGIDFGFFGMFSPFS